MSIEDNSISLPPEFRDGGILDFGREHALGFIFNGRCFEFQEDGTSVEVDGWSGELPDGWSWDIRVGENEGADDQ